MGDFISGSETRTQGDVLEQVFVLGEEAEFVFGKGTQLFPNLPFGIWGMTQARVVDHLGEKWFEVGFQMDHLLAGNPAAGWTDQGNYLRIDYEWSADLMSWSAGKFIGAPAPVMDMGGGIYQYWARALHPVDAAVKSGPIRVSSGYPGQLGDLNKTDARNNPFTGLTIAGVAQALGGFPYTMPGDAARMQADIRARGWMGATVEASSAIVWRIIFPSVNSTSYAQTSQIFWPVYLVANMFGAVVNPINGTSFNGALVDASGTPIFQEAFARLKISRGGRYDPYLKVFPKHPSEVSKTIWRDTPAKPCGETGFLLLWC